MFTLASSTGARNLLLALAVSCGFDAELVVVVVAVAGSLAAVVVVLKV